MKHFFGVIKVTNHNPVTDIEPRSLSNSTFMYFTMNPIVLMIMSSRELVYLILIEQTKVKVINQGHKVDFLR